MFKFLCSSLGKKYIMAITGLGLMGFVVAHLLGNLQIFIGAEAINNYAQKLKDLGGLLWVARIGLIGLFVGHAVTAAQLSIENKKARPIAYQNPSTIKATLSSRTMIISGLVVLSYLIYHILHFTIHCADPSFSALVDAQGRHDVYRMIVLGFSNTAVSVAYIVAMFFLAAHLKHGASSVFQSLGLNNSKFRCLTEWFGPVFSAIVFLGYGSIPFSVWMGWVR